MSRRFLFVLWDGGGSVPPQLAVARRLVERGHEVRAIAPQVLRARVEAAGCAFVPYRRAPEHDSRERERDLLRDWEAHTPLGMLALVRDRVSVGPALAFAEDTLEELERRPADAMATDYLLLGPLAAAERAGVPAAALFHQIYTLPAPGVPVVGAGSLPATGPLGRLRDALMTAIYGRLFDRGLRGFNEVRARLGLPPLARLFDAIYRLDRALVLTSQAFDLPSSGLPPNVRYVGAQLDDSAWTEPWRSPWPADHPDPLVVVSLSTTYQDQRRVIENIIEAVGGMPVRALVTVGYSLDPGTFHAPANVAVRQYVPHVNVFPEAAAVITHAGHGTVVAALAHGVPLVCLPMGRDQHDNAARVVWRGAGVRLRAKSRPAAIRAALRSVLDTPAYREGARRIAAQMAIEDSARLAVEELEALAVLGND
ncbi:MAG TPA: nucleotide disphospho-sugar-binding domain-containing protein [Solirubrobacterales bacterium]|jgi:UDP:flavonoid glycosyltransferase YjiC (YdhE family)